jgi:hypothetical protein
MDKSALEVYSFFLDGNRHVAAIVKTGLAVKM